MFWYARWPREGVEYIGLDERFFKLLWAVEIKWSCCHFEHPSELKFLLSFCVANNLGQAVVTAIDKPLFLTFLLTL
ncbi:hypothetical protein CR161_11120 [Prosthecochloris sp. ZM]|nr:hypothetical protein CR161_11120 [Prosthecochloris sp. ZM]